MIKYRRKWLRKARKEIYNWELNKMVDFLVYAIPYEVENKEHLSFDEWLKQ